MTWKALFVGVNTYDDSTIPNLQYAVGDAALLFAQFKAIGFEAELMANPRRCEVEEKIDRMTDGMDGADDVFLFYFAGHGFVAPGDDERLFCKDDFKRRLQYHSAGLSFAMLRDTTRQGGLNRIFILDACRANAFSEHRGDARPRDLVPMSKMMGSGTMPPNAGHCGGGHAIWRSCSSGQFAMELNNLEHGVFSLAIDNVMTECRQTGRELLFDRPFMGLVVDEMHEIANGNDQMPEDSYSGNWPGLVLIEGQTPKSSPTITEPKYVVCPICGANNLINDTFKCRICGKNYLCLRHLDKEKNCCAGCVEKYTPLEGKNFSVNLPDKHELEMLWVESGSFTMGSPREEPKRDDDEEQHIVCLTKGFWLGKYEVTYGDWKALMRTDLREQARKALNDDTEYSFFDKETIRGFWRLNRDSDPKKLLGNEDDKVPMHLVNYDECLEFCRRLNNREKRVGRLPNGYEYALPTEAQWEYACRADTIMALYTGPINIEGENNAPALDEIAWYGGNSSVGYTGKGWDTDDWEEKQYPGGKAFARNVGGKKPNPWGFYDMIGNVYEWCSDWYESYDGNETDPQGPRSGSSRVVRGGSWYSAAASCRAAARLKCKPSLRFQDQGFRLALVPIQKNWRPVKEEDMGNKESKDRLQSCFPESLDLSGVPLEMIKVKAGRFQMGSVESELGHSNVENMHKVSLTQDYWLGKTVVTQGQWKAIMGTNPSHRMNQKGDDYPVDQVSWFNAMEFCETLNKKFRRELPEGYVFSLPTEAQWEYACRAGTRTALNNSKNLTSEPCNTLDEIGWYAKNSSLSAHPVGTKKPNAWGFYDMHGNVMEWCLDWYDDGYGCGNESVTDPHGPSSGEERVRRGGNWRVSAMLCRSASRAHRIPSGIEAVNGFRLALIPIFPGHPFYN